MVVPSAGFLRLENIFAQRRESQVHILEPCVTEISEPIDFPELGIITALDLAFVLLSFSCLPGAFRSFLFLFAGCIDSFTPSFTWGNKYFVTVFVYIA